MGTGYEFIWKSYFLDELIPIHSTELQITPSSPMDLSSNLIFFKVNFTKSKTGFLFIISMALQSKH